MSFSLTPASPPALLFHNTITYTCTQIPFRSFRIQSRLLAYRRISGFPQGGNLSRSIPPGFNHEEEVNEEEEDDDDDEEDKSLDLLVKLVQNMFKRISKKARKAVRSVLPIPISTKLVGFAVNGVLVLACLWILKAFLEIIFQKMTGFLDAAVQYVNTQFILIGKWEFFTNFSSLVVCNFGTTVFVSILLVRVIWSGVNYLQEMRNLRIIDLDDPWIGSQPAM